MLRDLNFINVDWSLMEGNRQAQFLKVIQNNFLKQVILEPTKRHSILDLILTNREKIINQMEVGGLMDSE